MPNLSHLYAFSYPHALHHLELLQHAEFRSEIMKDDWRERLNQKQFDHWRTWYVPVSNIQVIAEDWMLVGQARAPPSQPARGRYRGTGRFCKGCQLSSWDETCEGF